MFSPDDFVCFGPTLTYICTVTKQVWKARGVNMRFPKAKPDDVPMTQQIAQGLRGRVIWNVETLFEMGLYRRWSDLPRPIQTACRYGVFNLTRKAKQFAPRKRKSAEGDR
jgi:hypothetical protein